MPDPTPPPPIPNPPTAPSTPTTPKGPTINIAAEFGTAKRNFPPAKILLITIAAVAVVVVVASYLRRAKPQGSGTLDHVVAVSLSGDGSTRCVLPHPSQNV